MKKFTFPLFSLLILWAFLFSGSLSLAQIPVVESHSSDALSITQGATSVSLPIPKPNGVQNGDLLIATIRVNCDSNTSGITITPPTGWTLIRTDINTSRSRTSLYYKIANNEGDIYTWQGGGGVSAFYSIFGGVIRISNADTNDPINVHSGNTTQNTSADVVASGVNTTEDNALLLYVGSISRVQGTFSTPAGMTKVFDRSTIYDGGVLYDDLGIMTVAWEDRPTAGSTGNRTASASAAGLYQTGQLLAINPGPPVPIEVYRSRQSGTWNSSDTWDQQFTDESWQNSANVPSAEPITNLFYPDIKATARYQTGSTISDHSVTLPDGIQAGDLLLMVFRAGS
ncbi:MAG: hypothetical protein GX168_03140, partial [Bacteroidales bacterium]|nr:hypothetical protein [Bacteroidales bacterium]